MYDELTFFNVLSINKTVPDQSVDNPWGENGVATKRNAWENKNVTLEISQSEGKGWQFLNLVP